MNDSHIPDTAAFGRLCVETLLDKTTNNLIDQPPSGGCVLKLHKISTRISKNHQPPSGGCVLKLQQRGHGIQGLFSRLRAAVC